jgi:hypothetical protein
MVRQSDSHLHFIVDLKIMLIRIEDNVAKGIE